MNSWLFLSVAIICNTIANIFIKKASSQVQGFEMFLSSNFLIGITLFGLNLIFYTLALKNINVSVGYPILVGVSLAGVTAIAVMVLGEKILWHQVLGLCFIAIGVAALSYTPRELNI